MKTNSKILIVGAGPTGLTTAIELYRRGYSPRIIDRKAAPSPLSRAVGINARSLDLLEPSGITNDLLAEGYKLKKVKLHNGKKTIGKIRLHKLPHRFNFLLALPQNETEEIMRKKLEELGGTVEYGHALTQLVIKDGKAMAGINEDRAKKYDLLIGADGAHSMVRQSMNIPFIGYDYPQRWSIADFESRNWPGDADLFFTHGGHVRFVVRIGENRYRAVADQPDALAGIPLYFNLDKLHRKDDFVISIRQAETYQKPPVYLAGDAAHVHSPAGGRGMNLGIEDGWDLARRIAEDDLEGYTAARHPVGAHWISLSERIVRGATANSFRGRLLRNLMISIVSIFSFLQVPLLKRVAGLQD